jgi:hypothetical protein
MKQTLPLIITTLLFCGAIVVYGQETKLNVISFNPCNSTYENDLLVTLFKDNKTFQISDSQGTILLPEPGEYKLKVFFTDFYRLTDSVKFINIHRGQNYDTLIRTTIIDCSRPGHGPDCGYFCCDDLCEGSNVDYFVNGKKKLEGYFKKGFPVGKLIFYWPDGTRKEIHYYDKGGKGILLKKETFDR